MFSIRLLIAYPFDVVWSTLIMLFLVLCSLLVVSDIYIVSKTANRSAAAYPLSVIKSAAEGLRELVNLRSHHVQPIEQYEIMPVKGKLLYGAVFLGAVALHVGVIIGLASIPGIEEIKDLLK